MGYLLVRKVLGITALLIFFATTAIGFINGAEVLNTPTIAVNGGYIYDESGKTTGRVDGFATPRELFQDSGHQWAYSALLVWMTTLIGGPVWRLVLLWLSVVYLGVFHVWPFIMTAKRGQDSK